MYYGLQVIVMESLLPRAHGDGHALLPSAPELLTDLITRLSTIRPPSSTTASRAGNSDNTYADASANANTKTATHPALLTRDRETNPFFSRLSAPQLAALKPLLLTLHSLLPNELLLALDILDRRLVVRLLVAGGEGTVHGAAADGRNADSEQEILNDHRDVDLLSRGQQHPRLLQDRGLYFVRSTASTSSARVGGGGLNKVYEVRLRAWTCSCPAFAFSAFGDPVPSGSDDAAMTLAGVAVSDSNDDHKKRMIKKKKKHAGLWFGGTLTRASPGSSPPVCKHLLACVLAASCPTLFGAGVQERSDVSETELAGWCAGWGG
jgi:hypothetical protein